jgi:hypothetical protein
MRGRAIRLGYLIVALGIVTQFALPPYLEHRVANRLTEHGGTARVQLSAVPAATLFFGHGRELDITAKNLSVDLLEGQRDVFARLDRFKDARVIIQDSRAGPFQVSSFVLRRLRAHQFDVLVIAEATAGDVARYAGGQLGGGFGQALAGLATGAIGAFERPVPVHVRMKVDSSEQPPRASDVIGEVAGLPAGPLAAVVTNALLSAY